MKIRAVTLFILLLIASTLIACGQSSDQDLMAEGRQYLENEDYQGAIVIYKTVLDKSPEKMEARLALGKAYMMTGKLDQAEMSFEKYARQNPYDPELLLETSKLKIMRKDYPAAIEILISYLEKSPESAEGHLLLGKAYWGEAQADKAVVEVNKSLELDPNSADAWLSLAHMMLATERKDESAKAIDELLAKEPDNRQALYFKAKLAQVDNDIVAYNKIFETIVQKHPSDVFAKYVYGKGLLEDGEFERVNTIALELIAAAPQAPYGKKLLGLLQYAKKEFKAVVNTFHEVVSSVQDPESYFYLGMGYYGLGDLETAITQLRIAAERSNEFLKAREMISLILLQQKRLNESIAEAEKIISIDPENVIARVILGDAYTAKGEADKALAQLKDVTEKDPHFASAFIKMGALHYQQGEVAESETALKGALNAAPDSVRPRLVLSSFYLRNGDKGLAKSVLVEGIKGTKEDVALYTFLARLSLMDRNPEEAIEYLNKAKVADPDNSASYMVLASIALAGKKPEEALAEYDAYLQKNSGFLPALLAKAAVLDSLKRDAETEAVYKEAIKTGHPRAFMAYAGNKRKGNDFDSAIVIIEDGLTKTPYHSDLMKMKADTLLAMKRFDDVQAMANDLERTNRIAAMSLRSKGYLQAGDYDQAIKAARELCDFRPKMTTGYLVLADINRRAGRMDGWGMALEEGVEKCGPEPGLMLELGRYHMALGDYNKALTYFDSIIKKDDKFFRAHAMRADTLALMGRKDKAVAGYLTTLEISEEYVPALNNLAMIYLEDSKTAPQALLLAYKAYLKVPWSASVLDTFGYALAMNGKYDAAVAALEKAVTVEANNPVINYHLGFAYHKAGKNEQAVATLKPVAECADCENADDARKLLKTINGD